MNIARCQGKVRFAVHAAAKIAAQRETKIARKPYFCRGCHGFHIGTSVKRAAPYKRDHRRVEAE